MAYLTGYSIVSYRLRVVRGWYIQRAESLSLGPYQELMKRPQLISQGIRRQFQKQILPVSKMFSFCMNFWTGGWFSYSLFFFSVRSILDLHTYCRYNNSTLIIYILQILRVPWLNFNFNVQYQAHGIDWSWNQYRVWHPRLQKVLPLLYTTF